MSLRPSRLPGRMAPERLAASYIALVAALVAVGAILQTPAPFLAAAVLTLPSSIVAVPLYYMLYGLTALIPGANPSSGSGEGMSTSTGDTVSVVTGEPALWFTLSMAVLAVIVMAGAAYLNARLVCLRQRCGATSGTRGGEGVAPLLWPRP